MRSHHQVLFPVLIVLLTLFGLVTPVTSHAKKKPFDRIVVFGTSLSDSGNAFVLNGDPTAFIDPDDLEGCNPGVSQNVPPYENLALNELLIPDGVYARGGHHVSNGATWIEQYALSQGLAGTTRPALQNDGTKASNYAVGGARAYDFRCRFNLSNQLAAYQEDFPVTSARTLIVIEMGSNDIRDALFPSPEADPTAILGETLYNITNTIITLYSQGARNFLVLNVPAIDKTPAILQLDAQYPGTGYLTDVMIQQFNEQLAVTLTNLQALDQINIMTLDIHTLLNAIIANPADYSITNVDTACVTPNIPPYTCSKPDTYVFWDGIHPTKAVHTFVAQAAMDLLEP